MSEEQLRRHHAVCQPTAVEMHSQAISAEIAPQGICAACMVVTTFTPVSLDLI